MLSLGSSTGTGDGEYEEGSLWPLKTFGESIRNDPANEFPVALIGRGFLEGIDTYSPSWMILR